MNKIIKFNIDTLKKVLDLISPLEEVWAIKNKDTNSDTIGRHIRHIIDFYLCFINGIDKGVIDYDSRLRNIKVEQNILYAQKEIEYIINYMHCYDKNINSIDTKINYSISNQKLQSSSNRELMYLADHAIHHGHIVQIILNNQFPSLKSKIKFYSPSTLDAITCV